MTFAIYTLGCKVNYYESTAICEKLKEGGLTERDFAESADIYIINTCAVTGESERKARQMIRRARHTNGQAYVIVTGCYSQLAPDVVASTGADFVCGNREKMLAAEAALRYAYERSNDRSPAAEVICGEVSDAPFEPMRVSGSERTRAYIKIGDGCDGKCTYCIIRKARGRVRSKPALEVIEEASALVASGYREIVLTAIELSAYGKDLEDADLPSLLEELSKIEGLERIRLSSLDPAMLSPAVINRLKNIRNLAHHFHLSLQSGCDRTLHAMKRKYNCEMVIERVRLLREAIPDVMFTADVIVGFPGESEQDFRESAEFLESLELLFMHIFTFSPRPGTEAADMPQQIDESIKNKRSKELAAIREKSAAKCMERYIGQTMPVIFEEYKDGYMIGHTANFIEVKARAQRDLRGASVNVLFKEVDGYTVTGEIV